MKDSIVEISGSKPGATVAIFAGIHGNEKAGVMAGRSVQSLHWNLFGTPVSATP